ncbi:hypothetical protein BG015_004968 [Linnemannia schmuckeri]|uniref:Uncharacterized protein n=1 Tax=Linnemannia schmuckeri TaxID=64567 RepID=A0A9P5S196_9FUNG|nr:hypothetical protein BG015_004968 [Linnemannia schmuckeri]
MYPNSVSVIKEVAPFVKRHCRHIRHIKARKEASDWYSWNPFDILDGVYSTLESFLVEYYDQGYDQISEDLVVASFQHHSVTLRDVRLSSCRGLSNAVIESILTTCAALERLEIRNRSNNCAVARLPEIVAHEWVCTGLKHLEMTVDWVNSRILLQRIYRRTTFNTLVQLLWIRIRNNGTFSKDFMNRSGRLSSWRS